MLNVNALVVLGIVTDFTDSLLRSFGLQDEWNLMWFGFKLIVLLFIISFVRSRFEGGPVITAIVLILGYLMLFQYWNLFGPIMFVYFLIAFGFTMVLYDLSIAGPMATAGGELPPDTGKSAASRRRAMLR